MEKLYDINNRWIQTKDMLTEENIFAQIIIEGYTADEDDCDNVIIAIVKIDEDKIPLVEWFEKDYRKNPEVQVLVKDSLKKLYALYNESHEKLALHGKIDIWMYLKDGETLEEAKSRFLTEAIPLGFSSNITVDYETDEQLCKMNKVL